ncbi:hypothetical protein [Pseudofrankia sp. DC12]|uniref:hypothetical protein n=1 Tax=Pseudofrankia sp. DC12 TaxID=683315 RepID=UPI0005F7BB59|nr:hypothetical protein [Pseudofrankia sp. DC12]
MSEQQIGLVAHLWVMHPFPFGSDVAAALPDEERRGMKAALCRLAAPHQRVHILRHYHALPDEVITRDAHDQPGDGPFHREPADARTGRSLEEESRCLP